jgi:glycosyltransferase involved in cell wall biosynthesis
MDLMYYYPVGMGGPNAVATGVLKCLLKREKELPFERIKLFVPTRDLEGVQEQFDDIEIITFKNINGISKNCLIHIPMGPLIFPNNKFLLHLFTIFKRRKLILQEHGDLRTEMQIKWKYEHHLNMFYIPTYILYPYLLKSADKLIVHSYRMSNLVRSKYGVKSDVVIPNAIDDFWFVECNKTNSELEGEPTLLYHGRLSPEKGVALLIKGFAKVIVKNSKAKLYISGEGPQRKQLEKLCFELGIHKNVIFLGYIDLDQLKSYLSSVDAAIYPPIYEPFSLAILEALSSVNGPVYYSSFAGIHDFIIRGGYNLNAFEPTINNIAKIIGDIIDRKYDIQVVKQQKKFARQFTFDKIINQYIEIYKDVAL